MGYIGQYSEVTHHCIQESLLAGLLEPYGITKIELLSTMCKTNALMPEVMLLTIKIQNIQDSFFLCFSDVITKREELEFSFDFYPHLFCQVELKISNNFLDSLSIKAMSSHFPHFCHCICYRNHNFSLRLLVMINHHILLNTE